MLRSVLLAAIALATVPHAACAAESYDSCAGTITSLPATISTPGVWCLKTDLSTAMSSGVAITINANNVTIDCNHFRLGGLAAGLGTSATGIGATGRVNATVRNCNVRGFLNGIYLDGDGHVAEDNRMDSNTRTGLYINADRFIVRRNLISQIGLSTAYSDAFGILATGAFGLIEGNVVAGVAGNTQLYPYASAVGIAVGAAYSVVRGNDVSGIYSGTDSTVSGIASSGARNKLIDNTVAALNSPTGSRRGLTCTGDTTAVAIRNVVSDASTSAAVYACIDGGDNVVH